MELTHYTEHPITFDRSRAYAQGEPRTFGKPRGLWVSVDGEDDWPHWCEAEEFHLGGLSCAYRVVLRPSADVLHLSGEQELDAFHARYAIQTEHERRLEWEFPGALYGLTRADLRRQWPIDWAAVTTRYDGLIIAPYLWDHRLFGPGWYYGWDCASGVIWRLSAIESFSEISNPTKVPGGGLKVPGGQ